LTSASYFYKQVCCGLKCKGKDEYIDSAMAI